jgi:hypothetical protein
MMPGFHQGRARNKGLRYPADPPKVERSSPSCAPPAMAPMAGGSAASAIPKELSMDTEDSVVVIDAHADNKPSASNA